MDLPSQSTLWGLFGCLVALAAVVAGGRGTGRRVAGVAVGILVAVGLVVWLPNTFRSNRSTDRSAAERTKVRAPSAGAALETARVATTQAVADARQAAREVQMSVRADLPDVREFGRKLRDAIHAGVQIEGQNIVIGAHAALPETPPIPPALQVPRVPDVENPDEGEAAADEPDTDNEEALAAAVQEDMTTQLTQYFDELVSEPPASGPHFDTKTVVLGTIGVLVAATLILKAATRRHAARA
jgi:hypothetical protein